MEDNSTLYPNVQRTETKTVNLFPDTEETLDEQSEALENRLIPITPLEKKPRQPNSSRTATWQ